LVSLNASSVLAVMSIETKEEIKTRKRQRWFIHYFDNGAKRWSDTAGKRIANEAKPYVDHVITYNRADMGEDFLLKRAEHFKMPRGAGYWVWKPRCLQLTLERMQDGDELLYLDTGCEIRSDVGPLFDLLEEQDLVCFEINDQVERKWNKRDLLIALDSDKPEYLDSKQRLTGYCLMRKTPETISVVEECLKFGENLHLIDDSPSITPNYPEFIEHRHDQSIWSLITKKRGYKAYPDPGWPLDKAKIIAASRRQD
jgi:hypothetical protein